MKFKIKFRTSLHLKHSDSRQLHQNQKKRRRTTYGILNGTGTELPLSIHSSHIWVLENFHSTTAFFWEKAQRLCLTEHWKKNNNNNLDHVQRLELSGWWFQCEVGEISLTKACRGGYRQICFLAFLIYSRGKRGVLRLFSGTGTLHFNVIISFACDSETISAIFFF